MKVSAQTTTFTYQGRLTDGTLAASGTYQMQFSIFDAVSRGTQLGTTLTFDGGGGNPAPVTVAKGVFTVNLDLSPASPFATGADRWIEIAVRKLADPPGFTILTPRQQITSNPFSIRSASANTSDSLSPTCKLCVTDAQIAAIDGSKVTGTVANAANADTATTAGNAVNLGGVPPSGYLQVNGINVPSDLNVQGNLNASGDLSTAGVIYGDGSGLASVVQSTGNQTIAGNKTFSNNVRTNGMLRSGSETGTQLPPEISTGTYEGLVIRRINIGLPTAGLVAARSLRLRLERDGTSSGWRIGYDVLPDQEPQSVHCTAVTSIGTVIAARLMISLASTGGVPGSAPLFNSSQGVEYMQCSFGGTLNSRHLTQVTLQRYAGSNEWVGTVTSTFNQ